jgi:hypothetical protein
MSFAEAMSRIQGSYLEDTFPATHLHRSARLWLRRTLAIQFRLPNLICSPSTSVPTLPASATGWGPLVTLPPLPAGDELEQSRR